MTVTEKTAVAALVVQELRTRGPHAAERLAGRLGDEAALVVTHPPGGDLARHLENAFRNAYELISIHHRDWFKLTDTDERRTRIVAVARRLLTGPADRAVQYAQHLQHPSRGGQKQSVHQSAEQAQDQTATLSARIGELPRPLGRTRPEVVDRARRDIHSDRATRVVRGAEADRELRAAVVPDVLAELPLSWSVGTTTKDHVRTMRLDAAGFLSAHHPRWRELPPSEADALVSLIARETWLHGGERAETLATELIQVDALVEQRPYGPSLDDLLADAYEVMTNAYPEWFELADASEQRRKLVAVAHALLTGAGDPGPATRTAMSWQHRTVDSATRNRTVGDGLPAMPPMTPFDGTVSFRLVNDMPHAHAFSPSAALQKQIDGLKGRFPDIGLYAVDVRGWNGAAKGYEPGAGYQTWDMAALNQRIDAAGVPPDAAVVLTLNGAGADATRAGETHAAGQLLADLRQGPVLAPWGWVRQGLEGTNTPVLLVDPPVLDGQRPAKWQPWVLFLPTVQRPAPVAPRTLAQDVHAALIEDRAGLVERGRQAEHRLRQGDGGAHRTDGAPERLRAGIGGLVAAHTTTRMGWAALPEAQRSALSWLLAEAAVTGGSSAVRLMVTRFLREEELLQRLPGDRLQPVLTDAARILDAQHPGWRDLTRGEQRDRLVQIAHNLLREEPRTGDDPDRPTRREVRLTGRPQDQALRVRVDDAMLAEGLLRPGGAGNPTYGLDAVARQLWPDDPHAGAERVHARLIEHSEAYRRDYSAARRILFGDADAPAGSDAATRLLSHVRAAGLHDSVAVYWTTRLEAGRAARISRGKQKQSHVEESRLAASGLVNQWAPLPVDPGDWSPLKQAEMRELVAEHNHRMLILLRSGVTGAAAQDAAAQLGRALGLAPRPTAQGARRTEGLRVETDAQAGPSNSRRRSGHSRHSSTVTPLPTPSQHSVFSLVTPVQDTETLRQTRLESARQVVARLEQELTNRGENMRAADHVAASDPLLRPLTDGEAEAWVEEQAGQSAAEGREVARAAAWRRLEQLEREAFGVAPAPDGTGSTPGTKTDGATVAVGDLQDLEAAQRPYLDTTATAPQERSADEFVTFDDESKVPAHLRNLGHSTLSIRGAELLLTEIHRRLSLPEEALDQLRFAFVDQPQQFFGDGYPLTYRDAEGRPHELIVTLTNYGNWSRYRDAERSPTKMEKHLQRRGIVGDSRSLNASATSNVNVPIGPGSRFVSPFGSIRFTYRMNEPTYGFNGVDLFATTTQLRGKDGTHTHVDDVWVSLRDVTEQRRPRTTPLGILTGATPLDIAAGRRTRPSRSTTTPAVFGFALRAGLMWVAADAVTQPPEPDLLPPEIPLTRDSVPQVFFTEDFGSVQEIYEWVKSQVPKSWLDSPSHAELRRFFTSGNFRSFLDRAFGSTLASDPLYKGNARRTVLGAVEVLIEPDSRPGSTATLVRANSTTEMRSQNAVKLTSERSLALRKGFGVGLTAGPAVGPENLRVRVALTGQLSSSRTESAAHGSSASTNAGLSITDHAGTYSMPLQVLVRLTGAEWKAFYVSAQLRIPRNEARRLAGWDDNSPLPPDVPEPFAPHFLTPDRPPTLGGTTMVKSMGWAEERRHDTTVLEEYFDRVHRALAALHPGLLLPPRPHNRAEWGWKHLADPRTWKRTGERAWPGSEQNYRSALANTLKLRNIVSGVGTQAGLERMTTVGLQIRLETAGPLSEEYVTVTLWAELTGRRFVGFRHDVGVSTGTTASHSATRTVGTTQGASAGLSAAVFVKDATGTTAGPFGLAGNRSRQNKYQQSSGPSTTAAGTSIFKSRSHVWAYDVSLTATARSYRRPRVRDRIATGNLLAAKFFVTQRSKKQLLGPGGSAEPVRAVVELYSPAALAPAVDPHLPGAGNPYQGRMPREVPQQTTVLAPSAARRLASGRPLPEFRPQFWQQRPYSVASVPFPRHLMRTVKALLWEVSGNAWFYRLQGTPAHDSLVDGLSPGQGDANLTLATSALGWQLAGLFGMGAVTDRDAAVVIRAEVRRLRPLLVVAKHEHEISYDNQLAAGSQTTVTDNTTVTLSAGGGHVFDLTGPGADGEPGTIGTGQGGLSADVYARTVSRSTAVQLSGGVTHILYRVGRSVLLVGDVDWSVAASSRQKGTLAGPAALTTTYAARKVTTEAGVLLWMGEQDALELGLIDDHVGRVPRWNELGWTEPAWSRHDPVFAIGDGAFDLSGLLADFTHSVDTMTSARSLVMPKTLLDDRTGQLTRLAVVLSPDGLRGLAHEMIQNGYSLRTYQPRVRSSREGTIEFRMERGTPAFHSLRAGTDAAKYRTAALTVTQGESAGYSWSIGPALSAGVVSDNGIYTFGGVDRAGTAYAQSSGVGRSAERNAETEVDGPTAVFETTYRMTIRVRVGEDERFSVQGDIGTLREHHLLSLLVPQSPGAGGHPTPAPPAVRPRLLPSAHGTPDAVRTWRQEQPLGQRLFAAGARGVNVQKVGNIGDLLDGALLTLDAATGADRPTGHTSSLVKAGSPVHDVLRNAITGTVMESLFHDALEQGIGLTLHGTGTIGGIDATLHLHPRVQLEGAELLAVDHGQDLLEKFKVTNSASRSDVKTDSRQAGLTGGPVFATDDPLFGRLGASGVTPAGTEAGSNSRDPMALHVSTHKHRLPVGRAFLFRFPVSWLQVAQVERRIKDSKVVASLASLLHLAPPTPLPPGVTEIHTPHGVYAWVREDVALEFGLLTDETYPDQVKEAWDAVQSETRTWAQAVKAYWATRTSAATARQEYEEALAEYRDATGEQRAEAEMSLDGRTARLLAVHRELSDRHEAVRRAGHRLHRARAAADALTAWHQRPAGNRTGVPPRPWDPDEEVPPPTGTPPVTGEDEPPPGPEHVDTRLRAEAGALDGLDDDTADEAVLRERRLAYAYGRAWITADRAYRQALETPVPDARLALLRRRATEAFRHFTAARDSARVFTDWYATAPDDRRGPAPEPWLPPARTEPKAAEDDTVARYTRETDEASGKPVALTAPDGSRHRVVDATPTTARPGSSFPYSLARRLDRALPGWRRRHGVPDGDGDAVATALRGILARALEGGALDDDATALDLKERITANELDQSGITLSDEHRREFDVLHTLPTGAAYALASRPELRRALLAAMLRRPGDAPDRTGWHHTAADLLAPLAAHAFGVRITVVRDDLGHQTFGDPDAPGFVLHLADEHWYVAEALN
ncbi:hypothetical protein [Streptomyces sp. NPDC056632]|uniref:hypothetical protein n=1 Tax=Streptomyces sp. NPDC056632 TaxID=3345884 RepID=UPI00368897C3